jgi:xanthine dehydrogenase molybdenum-binding subunit
LPGVVAVITADRVEQHPVGFAKDHLALKGGAADGGKVRCIRDEIAAVAALTEEIAQEAVRLIRVEYEELPAVFDPDSALRPDGPPDPRRLGSNLVNLRYQFAHGDVDSAFAQADVVVEGSYRLNYVTTACLGTMVAMASVESPGKSRRQPDHVEHDAGAIPLPARSGRGTGITGDRVRVIQPPVGGNFGRGLDLYPIDIIAALLSRRAGRPVKIAFERIEEFIASPTREPCVIHLRTAADRDGRLLARAARVVIDNGAVRLLGLHHAVRDAGHDGGDSTASPPSASTPPSSTPTTPTRAPCGATAISRARSPSRPRWTTWPSAWAWTGWRFAAATPRGRAT